MSAISDPRLSNEWRRTLVMASFRGIHFHVENSARQSGRRTVTHEYPKRNDPYAEDMGRHAVRWSFVGYIIIGDHGLQHSASQRSAKGAVQTFVPYADMIQQRNRLIEALEKDSSGLLYHPTLTSGGYGGVEGSSSGAPMMVMCERYSVTESREKGGYYEFDMQFVESGTPPRPIFADTRGNVLSAAQAAETLAIVALNRALSETPLP